jgi:hypothetical protein
MTISRSKLLKILGAKLHIPVHGSITTDEQVMNRFAVCSLCGESISSFYDEDEDRRGWREWSGKSGRCVGSGISNQPVTI